MAALEEERNKYKTELDAANEQLKQQQLDAEGNKVKYYFKRHRREKIWYGIFEASRVSLNFSQKKFAIWNSKR